MMMKKGYAESKLRHYCAPPSFSSAFMSITPPVSWYVSEAGSGVSSGFISSILEVLFLATDNDPVSRLESALDFRKTGTLSPDTYVANVNVIGVIEHVDGFLTALQNQGFDWNREHVLRPVKLKKSICIHARINGEVSVLHIDFGLHGAGLEVHAARKAHNLSGERSVDRIHPHLHFIADLHILYVVLGNRHAQAQKPALGKPDDWKILIVGVGATLDQGPSIGIAPR